MATGFNVRVGDADREAVAGQLREHYADGRLTLDELNERLDQAFAAKTRADLNAVLRDLPHVASPGADAPPRAIAGTRGAGGSGWDRGAWDASRRGRGFLVFAPLFALVWVAVMLGGILLFGGVGGRPLVIVLFIAALAVLRRLLFGVRRGRGYGGPRGPRGRRCR